MAPGDRDVAATGTFTTTDGRIQFTRNEDGDVLVMVRGNDGTMVATRKIPANEWEFLTRIL